MREVAGALDTVFRGLDSGEARSISADRVLQVLQNASLALADRLMKTGLAWPPYLASALKGIAEATTPDAAARAFFGCFTRGEAPALEEMGMHFAGEKIRMVSLWRIALYAPLSEALGEPSAKQVVGMIHPWLGSRTLAQLEGYGHRSDAWGDVLRDWRRAESLPGGEIVDPLLTGVRG